MRKKVKPQIPFRWVVRSLLAYSQETVMILQYWLDGEWHDVPVEKEQYPLPDGRTK